MFLWVFISELVCVYSSVLVGMYARLAEASVVIRMDWSCTYVSRVSYSFLGFPDSLTDKYSVHQTFGQL